MPCLPGKMTFAQLRALDAVARHGSFTRAADELQMTQPAVSHAVRKLEGELGVRLLSRTGGRVMLTAVGEVVARRIAVILNQAESMHQEVAAASSRQAGTLRIGAFASATARLLPPVLSSFRQRYPAVKLVLLEGSDPEVLDWLRTGAVDIATVTAAADGIDAIPVTSDAMFALVPPSHALAGRKRIAWSELARDPFIMSTGGCEPLIAAMARGAGVRLRRHYEVRDSASIVAMVGEGLGVSVMPQLSIPVRADICAIPLDPPERRELMLALPADAPQLPAARAFLELALETIGDPDVLVPLAAAS